MTDQFNFTPLRMGAPSDNLEYAIAIIQSAILAEATELDPEVMFGNCHFKRGGLEVAVALLIGVSGEVERLRWPQD